LSKVFYGTITESKKVDETPVAAHASPKRSQ
jgi:hypothetical protein